GLRAAGLRAGAAVRELPSRDLGVCTRAGRDRGNPARPNRRPRRGLAAPGSREPNRAAERARGQRERGGRSLADRRDLRRLGSDGCGARRADGRRGDFGSYAAGVAALGAGRGALRHVDRRAVGGAAAGARAGSAPAPEPRRTGAAALFGTPRSGADRKSTRLNSSHVKISYAVFCLKKKTVLLEATRTHTA